MKKISFYKEQFPDLVQRTNLFFRGIYFLQIVLIEYFSYFFRLILNTWSLTRLLSPQSKRLQAPRDQAICLRPFCWSGNSPIRKQLELLIWVCTNKFRARAYIGHFKALARRALLGTWVLVTGPAKLLLKATPFLKRFACSHQQPSLTKTAEHFPEGKAPYELGNFICVVMPTFIRRWTCSRFLFVVMVTNFCA